MKTKLVSLPLVAAAVLVCVFLVDLLMVVPTGKAIPAFSRGW
jgi:hypothetical protein